MRHIALSLALATSLAAVASSAVIVPGTSNIWLAGMPDGTSAGSGDAAPAQSPVLAMAVTPGMIFSFSTTGMVSNGSCCPLEAPDGGPVISHSAGAQHGMSNMTAPINSLIGVFLSAAQPDLSAAPAALLFDTPASRDFLTLNPLLKQVFFIGNGTTSTATVQQFTAPAGATRLFLGTMDGFGWFNNTGSFTVDVTVSRSDVPEPSTIVLAGAGLLGLALARRRR
jgi:PEP-CTERM motif